MVIFGQYIEKRNQKAKGGSYVGVRCSAMRNESKGQSGKSLKLTDDKLHLETFFGINCSF